MSSITSQASTKQMNTAPPSRAAPDRDEIITPFRSAPKRPVKVPGLKDEIVAMCFAEADINRDGLIDGMRSCSSLLWLCYQY